MTLGELIAELERRDPALIVPIGLGPPDSYRGVYSEVAFAPKANVSVAEMLRHAGSALCATFTGWKGGSFEMQAHTECWVAHPGRSSDILLTRPLLRYMLGEAPTLEDFGG